MRAFANPCRTVRCCSEGGHQSPPRSQPPQIPRRLFLALPAALWSVTPLPSQAFDIFKFPGTDVLEIIKERREAALAADQKATEAFEGSDFLTRLKKQSTDNQAKNKRALDLKYCKRQAEMGIGDCGGLKRVLKRKDDGSLDFTEFEEAAKKLDASDLAAQVKNLP
ncbi:hypothetical protein ACKKBF_B37865 [Auxenochlorella protothecoides x Auxenochlorella symbiontica]|uniref:Uncharacterized protein n=1 Tax=Auxenochlorella protothecoides TaxID=3075 RepID=A0A1D2A107_AUXPR